MKDDTPKIKLDEEGVLLECTRSFLCKQTNKQSRPLRTTNPATGRGLIPFRDYPTIEAGDFVLFLGCRHFQSFFRVKKNIASRLQAVDLKEVLKNELFTPEWYTSLNFLHKEQIVKVDWHGKMGLDQLHEASSFLYTHFRHPLIKKEKE